MPPLPPPHTRASMTLCVCGDTQVICITPPFIAHREQTAVDKKNKQKKKQAQTKNTMADKIAMPPEAAAAAAIAAKGDVSSTNSITSAYDTTLDGQSDALKNSFRTVMKRRGYKVCCCRRSRRPFQCFLTAQAGVVWRPIQVHAASLHWQGVVCVRRHLAQDAGAHLRPLW